MSAVLLARMFFAVAMCIATGERVPGQEDEP